jgi:hypothetical protein
MILRSDHPNNYAPERETWDDYASRFINAISFTVPWATFEMRTSWNGRGLTIVANDLRDNSPGMPKWLGSDQIRGEFMDRDFNIGHMDFTGYWLNDLEHFREVMEWYALHEIREQLWVNGERPWHPHLALVEENESSWNDLDARWAEAPQITMHEERWGHAP